MEGGWRLAGWPVGLGLVELGVSDMVDQFILKDSVVVSKIFYFYPYLGNPILTKIFQMGANNQLDDEEEEKKMRKL